jgi:hypothetical protein
MRRQPMINWGRSALIDWFGARQLNWWDSNPGGELDFLLTEIVVWGYADDVEEALSILSWARYGTRSGGVFGTRAVPGMQPKRVQSGAEWCRAMFLLSGEWACASWWRRLETMPWVWRYRFKVVIILAGW